jgi:ABC-type antimicrobial peptide transport system permease subunit
MTVVGVVENELEGGELGAPYQPMVYIDYLQLPKESFFSPLFSMTAQYAVRSKLPPDTLATELRTVVRKDAPNFAEMSLRSMEESIASSLKQRRLALRLVSGFGTIALLLSTIGIYGVLAYSVSLRRREIGVRLALGSPRLRVASLIIHQTERMVLLGLLCGIPGAWIAGRAIRSFLFGVTVLDPETVFAVGFLILLLSALAAFIPALRAWMVDPVETLRSE